MQSCKKIQKLIESVCKI